MHKFNCSLSNFEKFFISYDVHDFIYDCILFTTYLLTCKKPCFPEIYLNPRSTGETLTSHAASRRFARCTRNTRSCMCGQFCHACVSTYPRVKIERERRKKKEKKKRGVGYATAVSLRGVRVLDSHPRSRPSPPPFSPSASLPLFLSLSVSFPRCTPLLPFGLVLHRESRQRCTGAYTERKGEGKWGGI